ncbi:MAG: class I SAM-dependent methyltransferase [bacterium]
MDIRESKTAILYSEIHPLGREHYAKLKQILSPSFLNEESNFFKDKICLDAGCGLDRAVASMKMHGGKVVIGIDIAIENLKKARELNKEEKNVYFIQASTLKLPFKDEIFDFVHCSGVLHRTISPLSGSMELTRCLKTKGKIYLGLYGKGGIASFCISLGRLIAKIIPYKIGKNLLSIIIKNKLFLCNLLDVFYVPILERYTKDEIKQWFRRNYSQPVFLEEKIDNIFDSKLLRLIHPSSCYGVPKILQRLLYGEGWIKVKGIKEWKRID